MPKSRTKKDLVRINVLLDAAGIKKLEKIKSIGISTDTTAITMAIYHLAQHIERGEVFVDSSKNESVQ